MARYRPVDMSPRFLPVVLEEQLVPGTFAGAVHRLVDVLDLPAFEAHNRNDAAGAPAHALGMLLKALLLAYSQGIVSSRRIERACRENRELLKTQTGDNGHGPEAGEARHSHVRPQFRPSRSLER
jgi:transposase